MIKIITSTCVALVGLFASPGITSASITISHPDDFFFAGPETEMKLTNYESVLKGTGNTGSTIEVGDRFRGIFTITSSNSPGSGTGTQRNPGAFELTGIFDTVVHIVTPIGGGDALFELVPYAPFASEVGGPAGTMAAFYYDTSPDFTAVGTIAATEASATDGSLYMILGSNGVWGTDYYWGANGSTTPGVAAFAASLELLVNNTGFPDSYFQDVTQPPPISASGSFTNQAVLGTILNAFALQGNTVSNPVSGSLYQLQSQDPLRSHVVPEPISFMIWGLLFATCAAALGIRRRS